MGCKSSNPSSSTADRSNAQNSVIASIESLDHLKTGSPNLTSEHLQIPFKLETAILTRNVEIYSTESHSSDCQKMFHCNHRPYNGTSESIRANALT
jgi:hypothetical protein